MISLNSIIHKLLLKANPKDNLRNVLNVMKGYVVPFINATKTKAIPIAAPLILMWRIAAPMYFANASTYLYFYFVLKSLYLITYYIYYYLYAP